MVSKCQHHHRISNMISYLKLKTYPLYCLLPHPSPSPWLPIPVCKSPVSTLFLNNEPTFIKQYKRLETENKSSRFRNTKTPQHNWIYTLIFLLALKPAHDGALFKEVFLYRHMKVTSVFIS